MTDTLAAARTRLEGQLEQLEAALLVLERATAALGARGPVRGLRSALTGAVTSPAESRIGGPETSRLGTRTALGVATARRGTEGLSRGGQVSRGTVRPAWPALARRGGLHSHRALSVQGVAHWDHFVVGESEDFDAGVGHAEAPGLGRRSVLALRAPSSDLRRDRRRRRRGPARLRAKPRLRRRLPEAPNSLLEVLRDAGLKVETAW